MQIIPSQGSTQKFIIYKFAGFQIKRDRTSHNCSERVNSCQNCLKKSLEEYPSVSVRSKSVEFMVTIVSSKDHWQRTKWWTSSEFYYDEIQPHTSTRSELNLIKSVIYIYICNLFYILYLKNYLLQFYNKWIT